MMYQLENRQSVDVARLEDYLNAFRQRWMLVLSCLIAGLILALAYASTTVSQYTATAEVRLRPTPVGAPDANRPQQPTLEEERRVVSSDAVAAEVKTALNAPDLDRRELNVMFTPDSRILLVMYTADDPERASQVANSFATTYAAGRTADAAEFWTNAIQEQTDLIARTDEALEQTRSDLTAQKARLSAAGGSSAEIESNILVLNREIDNFLRQNATASTAINAAEIKVSGVESQPPGEVLIQATPPTSADGIPRSLLIVAGSLFGLVLGLISAFFLERLDTTARDDEDVALALGTSVIGGIPTLGIGHRRGSSSLIMFSTGGSARIEAAREAFRRLRNSLMFLNSSTGVSSVIVTSSAPSEGKSLTSANLSIALAQNGSRVVLVSADLRRPSLEKMFGMEAGRPGLSEYLSQTAELNAEKVPGMENLWLIRAGVPPSNPSELLNSDRFEQLVKELEREDVEYIIVDTPPVLSTSDAMSAARYVDGVIIVVDAEQTDTSDLLQVRADLERTGTKLLGAVLNRRKFESGGLFRRNNKYAYYHAEIGRARGN